MSKLPRAFNRKGNEFYKAQRPKLPSEFVLEIGAGVGLHPLQYALENPNEEIVAVERTSEKFKKFQGRYESHGRPNNLHLFHTNAESFVSSFVKDQSIQKCFILYPNPNLHANGVAKRWVRMPFFHVLLAKLKLGGEVVLVTNEESYSHEAREFFGDIWKLEIIQDSKWDKDSIPFKGRTHFERKYLERGESVFQLVGKKTEETIFIC